MTLRNKILSRLIDKYESSKLSKGGTKVSRTIELKLTDPILKPLTKRDSYKYIDEYTLEIKALSDLKYIKANYDYDTLQSITLCLDKVDEIYKYLKRVNPQDIINDLAPLLIEGDNTLVNKFKEKIKAHIAQTHEIPKSYFKTKAELQTILTILNSLLSLNKPTKKREFSVKALGDSKLFEKYEGVICKILKDFTNDSYTSNDELLESYNIIKNSTYALIKNKLCFRLNNQTIDLDQLGFEYSLSDEMIEKMEILDSNISKIITVENLTTFYTLDDKEALIIYLAGFHNHTKQNLLIKLYSKYNNIPYYHFSDIDCGGISIFTTLKDKTGIPFIPYKMSKIELINNKPYLKTLTDTDIERLKLMLKEDKYSTFHEVILYMLENNCKLEQEALE